ncbi:hypothetical protein SCARR_05463 [Pontiella sulfatireligans]|uniref:Uncharacterized protein n=2 Tax=Pontiella sulfatireligans TaxID=2750658 RepID=A0A6C2UWY2_9BACT|nr:hypothetical protein SCARR_05463 [Pontiella sulfatireligans]
MTVLKGQTWKTDFFLLSVMLYLISIRDGAIIMEGSMENKKKFKPDPDLKLMDQVREVLRYHHYAYRTEQTYWRAACPPPLPRFAIGS